jgi:hypothetical protein
VITIVPTKVSAPCSMPLKAGPYRIEHEAPVPLT